MEIGNSNYKGHKQIICISKKEEGPRFFSLSLEKKGDNTLLCSSQNNLYFSNYQDCIRGSDSLHEKY